MAPGALMILVEGEPVPKWLLTGWCALTNDALYAAWEHSILFGQEGVEPRRFQGLSPRTSVEAPIFQMGDVMFTGRIAQL